jgi:hypothetical protein
MRTLVLFDADGTLLVTAPRHRWSVGPAQE